MVYINRSTTGVELPAEVSQEVWSEVQAASVVMGLARRVTLSGAGTVYHEILTDSSPEFVGETSRKPVSNPTVTNKTLKPHKIAVVQTYSDEFRRDLPGLFNALTQRLPGALARTFDLAALHGTGAPAADFDDLSGATTISIVNDTAGSVDAYAGFLSALAAVPNLNGWALSPLGEVTALSNRDVNGSPILVGSAATDGSVGFIAGRPVFRSQNVYEAGAAGTPGTPATLGIGGDWTKAVWGQVEAISVDISDNPVFDDTGTLVTAGWQDNMISVRAEMHVGFIVDDAYFVRLTGDTPTA
jgi:HK97 family phage major capsid protein